MRKKRYEKVGRPASLNRPVAATNVYTGEERVFKNYREAAKAINGNRGVVFLCLDGIRKTHRGYEFRYADFE